MFPASIASATDLAMPIMIQAPRIVLPPATKLAHILLAFLFPTIEARIPVTRKQTAVCS